MLLRAVSLAIFLVGVGFALWAAIQWLQTAKWQPLTVNGALASWPPTREWLAHPRSWLGLHRVLAWLLRVPVFVIGLLLGGVLLLSTAPRDQTKGVRYY